LGQSGRRDIGAHTAHERDLERVDAVSNNHGCKRLLVSVFSLGHSACSSRRTTGQMVDQAYQQPGREPWDALQSLSADGSKHCHGGSIDVRTGVGNFLRGVTPNQDILTVASGDNDGGSGEVVMESWLLVRKGKRAFFAAPASEACSSTRSRELLLPCFPGGNLRTAVGPPPRRCGNDSPTEVEAEIRYLSGVTS
jgi:hypothetical protein